MIRFSALIAGVLVFGAARSACADDGKLKLGVRLGYAVPAGKVSGDQPSGVTAGGQKLSDWFPSQIPIWLDAGYMVTPNVLVGLYGQYGFLTTNGCDANESCSAHEIRFGLQGQYHLAPGRTIDPWLGAGVGYEFVSTANRQAGNREDVGMKGWEFLNLQGGVDFELARSFTLGPFLSVSFDQFSSASLNDHSYDIPDKALHEWITLGAKGTFGL